MKKSVIVADTELNYEITKDREVLVKSLSDGELKSLGHIYRRSYAVTSYGYEGDSEGKAFKSITNAANFLVMEELIAANFLVMEELIRVLRGF